MTDFARQPLAVRDAAYDNAAAVPESTALIAAWSAASADFRARHGAHLDISYGPRERTKWDLFPGAPNAPCLVFIHGGYWLRNSREVFACMAEGVRAHGWSAALPGYTLCPNATLTEITREIGHALDWLSAHRAEYGINGHVILSGWSAGGQLATYALDHHSVSAGLAISGLFDLGPLRHVTYNDTLNLTEAECLTLSPQRLPASRKPLTLAYGTIELPALIANSCDYHAKRTAAGAPGPLLELEGRNHFDILEQLRSPDGALTLAALALTRR